MPEEVEFLFDNQLIAALENLIRNAKTKLLLVSPFIDLDARIIDALNEKKHSHNFELQVLFGKNENNYLKSIKKDSLAFFKSFPNVEIRYNERLHAKYYQNDVEYIMTSLNLYDYSLANNIEVGVRCEFGFNGVLGKTIDASLSIVGQGVNLVKQDVLGMEKKIGPIEKFELIFNSSELKYKTRPIVSDKGGIQGFLGGKKLEGFEVVSDTIETGNPQTKHLEIPAFSSATMEVEISMKTKATTTLHVRHLSASQLAKNFGMQSKEVTAFMQKQGLIRDDQITDVGKASGLILKNYMGNDYIAYPENLEELSQLKK